MNYTEFEKKVKSMNAHDIIMAMVEGLRNPRTEIDMTMTTFGKIEDGICYGGAATNATLHIMNADEYGIRKHILGRVPYRLAFPDRLEIAIDCIRRGDVDGYNHRAIELGFAPITPIPGVKFPYLDTDYTEDQLQVYVELAQYQLTV